MNGRHIVDGSQLGPGQPPSRNSLFWPLVADLPQCRHWASTSTLCTHPCLGTCLLPLYCWPILKPFTPKTSHLPFQRANILCSLLDSHRNGWGFNFSSVAGSENSNPPPKKRTSASVFTDLVGDRCGGWLSADFRHPIAQRRRPCASPTRCSTWCRWTTGRK